MKILDELATKWLKLAAEYDEKPLYHAEADVLRYCGGELIECLGKISPLNDKEYIKDEEVTRTK